MSLPNDLEPISPYWPQEHRDLAITRLRGYFRWFNHEFHTEHQITITPQGYIRVEVRPEPEHEAFGAR